LYSLAGSLEDAGEFRGHIFCEGIDTAPEAKIAMGRNHLQEFEAESGFYIPVQQVPAVIKK
jgi:hypothetical protein